MRRSVGMLITGAVLITGAAVVATGSVDAAADVAPQGIHAAQAGPSTGKMVGASEHSNVVNIQVAQGSASSISTVNFTPSGSYSITAGQPWSGVTASSGSQSGSAYVNITANAGRSGSSGPAEWFTQNENVAIADDTFLSPPAAPSDLNFAFTGTLTIDGHDYQVVIGQGHQSATNNWWFGGQGGWTNNSGALVTPDGAYTIQGYGDVSNGFAINAN